MQSESNTEVPADPHQGTADDPGEDLGKQESSINHYIVGVGASAGGLEPLEKMFSAMPEDTGMSFVIVQHLSPDFESHMDKLLSRVTNLPIHVVSNGDQVQPNAIYLIPPKKEMVISNGRLLLTERSSEKVLAHPIDQFFRALSHDAGRFAIGVILSGTGSDGSRGVIAITDAGGLAIAQDPETCHFDGMPASAKQTGKVQLTLAPEEIGEQLSLHAASDAELNIANSSSDDFSDEGIHQRRLQKIFQILQQSHRIDFAHYKSGTIGRRVQRRIDIKNCGTLEAYVDLLSDDPVEANELYKDLLIGVTNFFRDRSAFELLERDVIPEIVEKCKGDVIRVWVCACATGEEAYTLAMLLSEAIERSGTQKSFKIFATDAHKSSLQFAATGVYEASMVKDISDERLERFFVEHENGYSVSGDLRRSIVFAPHNVISDPPFTQMNMVTCRNMLIYLQTAAQRKTLSLFHFSLKLNGILFLGPSESTGDIGGEFEVINSHWKVYRKRRDVRLPLEMRMPIKSTGLVLPAAKAPTLDAVMTTKHDVMPAIYDQLLGKFMPPSIAVDQDLQVLHVFPGAEQFLQFRSGRPSTHLLSSIVPSLKLTVASAVQHAIRDHSDVRYSGIPFPEATSVRRVEISISPVELRHVGTTVYLIRFDLSAPDENETEDVTPVSEVDFSTASLNRIETLERDLDFSRQNLQATIEELETSNEELQATNEEMVAANEELQSTNEELHSVNEELYTVNGEHQRRLAELDEANADMHNLLATTRVGVVFVDNDLKIRRMTPAVEAILQISVRDLGRDIQSFLGHVDGDKFVQRLCDVRDQRQEKEWEVTLGEESYLIRALPYWAESRVIGVVIAFVSVQSLKKAQRLSERFEYMCDAAFDGQLLLSTDGNVVYANESICNTLDYTSEEMIDIPVIDFDSENSVDDFREKLDQAKADGGLIFESTYRRKDGSELPVEVSISHVMLAGETFVHANVRDISLRRSEETKRRMLEGAVASVTNGIVVTDSTQDDNPIIYVNRGFLAMTGYSESEVLGRNCRFLQGKDTSPDAVKILRDGVAVGEPSQALLVNYKKDGTPFWNDLYLTPLRDNDGAISNFVGIQNDLTERIKTGEAAEKSENTIRLLLNSTAEGIYGIDRNGLCTFCNTSAARMLGYDDPSELISRSMHDLVHHHRSDGTEYRREDCPIFQSLQSGERVTQSGEVFWRKDGKSFPVQYWSHAIRNDDKIVGGVVTFVDISERLDKELELREARDQANLANQTKSRFLANMSHELRTPMAAILGFTDILLQEISNEEISNRLHAIRRNGDYLLRLLNDVLDLSRIEAGKLNVSKEQISLQKLLGHVYELMDVRTKEYRNSLELIYHSDLPVTISTDEARLRQVLINLIANALKFSPDGSVQVLVELIEDEQLQIKVVDDGIGMNQEQQSSLFEPFTQASDQISERFGGTGLGLSITHRLVEALDGLITVESQTGAGSTFTVTIPVGPMGELANFADLPGFGGDTTENGTESDPTGAATPDSLDAKVLIADDMRDVRYVAEHVLRNANCRVHAVENGQQAIDSTLQAIEEGEPFDLVLMDMQMPVLSGEEAMKELRSREIQTPIIALTADAMKGTRQRVLDLGFSEYMTKPLDAKKLIALAAKLLRSPSP